MKFLITTASILLIVGCEVDISGNEDAGADATRNVEWLRMPGTEEMDLPFSAGVRVDNVLYLSGALGIVPGTRSLAEGGIQAETRQTLENIAERLETFGSSMDKVVKCTVFLADMSEWGAMNEVYTTFFVNKPARSAVGASGLALDARVEIECIAVID